MKAFVVDVDGCLTDGQMWYSRKGKMYKAFGADDHDALNLIRGKIEILFVTADSLGWEISLKRIEDMGFHMDFLPMSERVKFIARTFGLAETIYMGDGILDPPIFEKVGYSICPADGFYLTREKANYVTRHKGGHRAVAEACMHIKEKFGL